MARDEKKPKADVATSLRGLLKGVQPAPPAAPAAAAPAPRPEVPPSDGLAGDDRTAFHQAMAGVRPLAARTLAKENRRATAVAATAKASSASADDAVRARLAALVSGGIHFQIERDGERIRAHRAGAPARDAQALERSGVVPEATLDLHGMTSADAERAVVRFVRDRHRRGVRRVCLVHGKGLHSEGGVGVLSDRVVRVLTEGGAAPVVHAFATAPQELGGAGALIVQLTRR